ncbi:hypothetical protein [Catenulispora pinisilvae]|uniref:hypothetical protein n=1 Tax=Catenulispora pinisilvae TaxID=2705253 RepID=UPI0018917515|nr:hypothetical protein [Catenulispora pinisilvae]
MDDLTWMCRRHVPGAGVRACGRRHLGVDTFAVAAAVGAAKVKPQVRRRITALFVAFEAGMPLVGPALAHA